MDNGDTTVFGINVCCFDASATLQNGLGLKLNHSNIFSLPNQMLTATIFVGINSVLLIVCRYLIRTSSITKSYKKIYVNGAINTADKFDYFAT